MKYYQALPWRYEVLRLEEVIKPRKKNSVAISGSDLLELPGSTYHKVCVRTNPRMKTSCWRSAKRWAVFRRSCSRSWRSCLDFWMNQEYVRICENMWEYVRICENNGYEWNMNQEENNSRSRLDWKKGLINNFGFNQRTYAEMSIRHRN